MTAVGSATSSLNMESAYANFYGSDRAVMMQRVGALTFSEYFAEQSAQLEAAKSVASLNSAKILQAWRSQEDTYRTLDGQYGSLQSYWTAVHFDPKSSLTKADFLATATALINAWTSPAQLGLTDTATGCTKEPVTSDNLPPGAWAGSYNNPDDGTSLIAGLNSLLSSAAKTPIKNEQGDTIGHSTKASTPLGNVERVVYKVQTPDEDYLDKIYYINSSIPGASNCTTIHKRTGQPATIYNLPADS